MKPDNGPAYFNAGKGSRRREGTKEGRRRFRANWERIFGKRELKLMKREK